MKSWLYLRYLRWKLKTKTLNHVRAAEISLRRFQLDIAEDRVALHDVASIEEANNQVLWRDLKFREAMLSWLLTRTSGLGIPLDPRKIARENVLGRDVPTEAALREMAADIRREEAERRSVWGYWVTSLTGLVGALIGLVAIVAGR